MNKDGILIIDKPAGPTSHDVVQMVKRTIGAQRVGHLGTLDPSATGVLPLCIEGATKFASSLSGGEKVYSFQLVLGTTTDTDDDRGTVISERPVEKTHLEQLSEVVNHFIGETLQVPPHYSARKVKGRRMYKLARRGVAVDAPPRRVRIHELTIERVEGNIAYLRMRCGGGTYVRALCRDIGSRLGCGAHAASIRRLQSGRFTIDQAMSLADVATKWRDSMITI